MPDVLMNGFVKWKGFMGTIISMTGLFLLIGFNVTSSIDVDIKDVKDNSVTRKEWEQAEMYRHQFLKEYREDQKIHNQLLRELIKKVSKLEVINISKSNTKQ